MENTEILVLTGIICTLFALFIIGPLFYAHQMNQNNGGEFGSNAKDQRPKKELETLNHLYREILTEQSLSKKEKLAIAKIMNRTISDMDSDGVYFPESLPAVKESGNDPEQIDKIK